MSHGPWRRTDPAIIGALEYLLEEARKGAFIYVTGWGVRADDTNLSVWAEAKTGQYHWTEYRHPGLTRLVRGTPEDE